MIEAINPLEELVAACEAAFAGNDGMMDHYPDDEDVSTPGTGITFGMIRRARAALAEAAPQRDWTVDPETNRSNSSPRFLEIADAVGELLRDSAHSLIRGATGDVGRLIVAQLAHKHGLAPQKDEA